MDADVCFQLTVVDETDWGAGVRTGTHFSCFEFLKTIGQPVEEVFLLLSEAEPQVELQLSLDCPARRSKSLLPRQLATQIMRGDGVRQQIHSKSSLFLGSIGEDRRSVWPYLQEDCLDFAAVFSFLFIHRRVEDVFGGNASVGDALVVAQHPDEQVWDAVLRLDTFETQE